MITACLCIAQHAMAQVVIPTDTAKEVVITENRLEIPFRKLSQNIDVISTADIKTRPARSVPEILSYTGGMDVRQRGPGGVQADLSIRGGGFEQSLVLLNGIKLSDPQTGHHLMAVPVPTSAIERIDILKGPGARIFGQNAFSGAVNIVTMLPEKKSLELQAFGGDFGYFGGQIYFAMPVKNFRQAISASYQSSNGYQYNSDFKLGNILYESGWQITPRQEIRLLGAYSTRDFGANGYYSNRFPDQWEKIETGVAAISHTYKTEKLNWQTRISGRSNNDEFRLKRNDPKFYTNTHESEVLSAETHLRYNWKFGTSGIGFEYRTEDLSSSNLGDRSRYNSGIFAEHRIEFMKKIDLRAGVYGNYYNEYGWQFFPGAELGYQISGALRTYINGGSSYRIPSFTELYYQDPSNLSNDQLKPEQAFTYEGGIRYLTGRISATLSAFQRRTNNQIDYFRLTSDSAVNINKWQPENQNDITFSGISFNTIVRFSAEKKAIRPESISFSYNYLEADIQTPIGTESRYTLDALKQQWIGGFQFAVMERIHFSVYGKYLIRYSGDPYFLLDAKVAGDLTKHLQLFGEATNITNTEYIESGYVTMPGRWFSAGVRAKLF